MLPVWTTISSLDGSTLKTAALLPREETYTISPTLGTWDFSATYIGERKSTQEKFNDVKRYKIKIA
jgi:hypothetical protein